MHYKALVAIGIPSITEDESRNQEIRNMIENLKEQNDAKEDSMFGCFFCSILQDKKTSFARIVNEYVDEIMMPYSTASIILAHLKGEPLDIIVFAEVMFDKYISGENPCHIDFIMKKAKPLFESWGYEVVIVHSNRTYLDCFNRVINRPVIHMNHKGKKHGFPLTGACLIKRDLKIRPIEAYYRTLNGEEYIQYIGIGIDEPERLNAMRKDSYKISLMEKYGYTTDMAKKLCEEYGLLSPVYELSRRGGCWMCPFAKLEEHRAIRKLCPDAWAAFVALEDRTDVAYHKWSIYGETLKEREKILSKNET